ncbi:hypothetical protein OESDEN_14124 [Oesophagostomum dentatum]|uniref:C2H2-type domain-containing protein n=1 Tax=Oesophagostomum dentatum TaxID=61180 RepID=A0A0B1SMK9_OESDE|nr:hypothetical protein OESDEN_14124 [Oesophagostomum dentatum]
MRKKIGEEVRAAKPPPEAPNMYCPICDEGFMEHEEMAKHCEDCHSEDGANGKSQDYTIFRLVFDSKDDFEEWLTEQCERTSSSFYTRSSYRGGTSYSLRCNRAGRYEKETMSRATSSKKDVINCSCFVNVHTRDDGKVDIKGRFGHVGHGVEPALLRLSNTQEEFLKSLLEEHSMDYILRRLKRDYSPKTSRLWFVERSDLWNLTTKFGLRPGHRDNNDMNSLMLRRADENPDDGIRLLEISDDPSGKGFCMVIITPIQVEWLRKYSHRGIAVDDTHNITRYNLKLATVSVADHKDPFMLSGTMTTSDVQKMFTEIKKVIPNFDPQQIVTDEAPCFYNGFRAIFPHSRARLHYCRWHVDQTFNRAATKYVEVHLRERVKRNLRKFLSIVDLNAFEHRFAEILAYLDVENQTATAKYPKGNYLGRTASWASFANRNAVMGTAMISERWHLRLKKDFLQRNANSRADFLVDLLIRAVEDLSESTEIKDRRRLAAASYRVQQTAKSHRWALKHYEGKPEKITQTGNNTWNVEGRNAQEVYTIRYDGGCVCASTLRTVEELGVQEEEAPFPIEAPEPSVLHPVTAAQERKQERNQLRSSIESRYAVVNTHVNILVNTDTDDSLASLKEIYELIDRASRIN